MQRMMVTLILAFVLAAVLGKFMLPVLHRLKFGQNIYELAPEAHKKKQGTPRWAAWFLRLRPSPHRSS